MHANVQTRFNPATGDMAPYYRIKESYRDVQGHVHSLILLNIGFEPSLTAVQVRKIAYALTERFKTRSTPSLFIKYLEGLTPIELYVVKQKCTTANIVIYSDISLFYYQKFFC